MENEFGEIRDQPAFPATHRARQVTQPGMSFRDYFAAQAMNIAYKIVLDYMPENNTKFKRNIALHSYRIADEMLAVRGEGDDPDTPQYDYSVEYS